MVGLVVVSHSRALARAAAALAAEMVAGEAVPVEVAAGLDDTTTGTDAAAIAAAITAADRGDGVVVLMDLGSAVLSAELALELLDDPELRERTLLCAAPLVEGLVVAAVTAAGGADRWAVAEEANAALAGKQNQLGAEPAPESGAGHHRAALLSSAHVAAPPPAPAPSGGGPGCAEQRAAARQPGGAEPPVAMVGGSGDGAVAVVVVRNPHGLHARPAARLVARAREFDATVEIRNRTTGSGWVPAGSLSRVATLGVLCGHEIEVRAGGPQAAQAVDALAALAGQAGDIAEPAAGGGPVDGHAAWSGAGGGSADGHAASGAGRGSTGGHAAWSGAAGGSVGGHAASPGVAIGPARLWHVAAPEIPDISGRGAGAEWERLAAALAAVRRELEHLRGHSPIFEAHLLLLDDEELLGAVRGRLDDGESAPRAWADAMSALEAEFGGLADPYLAGRAADVRAVAAQVLRALLGDAGAAVPGPGILVAADLTPADAAMLDPGRVTGVLLAFGSPTSHAAILTRGLGIPAVVGMGAAVLDIPSGTVIALDGASGEVAVAPPEEVLEAYRRRAADQPRVDGGGPAVTRDGVAVAVGANVGSVGDARRAVAAGADLAGLVRTEFLFLGRDTAPDVEEQEAVYREIAATLGGRRVTLRTLDVGGDKPLRYLPGPAEANPFLGVRGIRHSLAHPELLAGQLRAIVRVARDFPVSVMFPMVSTVDEVRRARAALDRAVAGEWPPTMRVGIMLEVPAAVLKAKAFLPYVDFVSLGTNDLTQYALAAERGNPALAGLADGCDPGVLRLVDVACRAVAGRAEVAVCGELAADAQAVPLLVALGVRELSVAPPLVPAVKAAVRAAGADPAAVRDLLELPDAAAVRRGYPAR